MGVLSHARSWGVGVPEKKRVIFITCKSKESRDPCSAAIQAKDHPSIHFSICLLIQTFIYLSIHLSKHSSICPPIYPASINPLSIHLSVNLLPGHLWIHSPSVSFIHTSFIICSYSFVYLLIHKCIHLSSHLRIRPLIYPSVYPTIKL